ncbi:hypothetical protein BDW66DRAFT_143433 [Aspergillus desertorum]
MIPIYPVSSLQSGPIIFGKVHPNRHVFLCTGLCLALRRKHCRCPSSACSIRGLGTAPRPAYSSSSTSREHAIQFQIMETRIDKPKLTPFPRVSTSLADSYSERTYHKCSQKTEHMAPSGQAPQTEQLVATENPQQIFILVHNRPKASNTTYTQR